MSLKSVIASAKSWVGTGENPPGSNIVPGITDWLHGAQKMFGDGYAWCAAAVSRWMYDGGERDLCKLELGADSQFSNGFASTDMLAKAFEDRGRIFETPKVGDLVLYDFDKSTSDKMASFDISHVGLVEGINQDGSFRTIEGNTSGKAGDGVYEKTRHLDDTVVGFARPDYGEGASSSKSNPESPLAPSYPGTVLEHGDTGAEVRAVQERLNAELDGHDLKVDGQFGPDTEAAVLRFQTAHHLATDGEVGPKTWAALFDGGHAPGSSPANALNPGDTAAQHGDWFQDKAHGHCQLKRPWYARRVGGAAARVGELLCSPIMLPRSSEAGPEKAPWVC